MIPTNRSPPGLLSFFGVKNGGRNPQYSDAPYQSVIEVLPWLAADPLNCEILKFASTIGALGTFSTVGGSLFRVPAGQIWYVTDFSVFSATLGAGVTVQFTPATDMLGDGTVVNMIAEPSVVWTVGQVVSHRALKVPLILWPNQQIGVWVNQLAGAAPSLSWALRFCRLVI